MEILHVRNTKKEHVTTNMAVNRPGDIIDAILSNPELRNTLTRAVEASGSDREVATRYNAVEQEVSTVFRPNQQVPVATRATPPILPQVPLAPIFQMRRNYASQPARRRKTPSSGKKTVGQLGTFTKEIILLTSPTDCKVVRQGTKQMLYQQAIF